MSNTGTDQHTNGNSTASAATSTNATCSGNHQRKGWVRTVNITSDGRTVNITNASGKTMNINASNATTTTTATAMNDGGVMAPEQLQAITGGMGPEAVAKYMELQRRMATAGAARGGGAEVKISFGPSRPPQSTTTTGIPMMMDGNASSAAAAMGMMASMATAAGMGGNGGATANGAGATFVGATGSSSSSSSTVADIDMERLKERAAAVAAGQNAFRNKHGTPCTEAEMKALMGMFVEIMGMSVNNTGSSSGGKMPASSSDGGPMFSFGANSIDPSSFAAAAAAAASASGGGSTMMPDMAGGASGFFSDGAAWEALRRTYAAAEQVAATNRVDDEDEDEDDDIASFENRELTFEEIEFLLQHRKQKEEAAKLASQFTAGDWESLEQVAISDHLLEEDDKERKAAKKREKKQRRKAKLKEEAAQKAAETAQKKRDKAIISWRSRVVSACQSNETIKLENLLQDSPLKKLQEGDGDEEGKLSPSVTADHLEFLLPNAVAKNRAHVERGLESRLRLGEYILSTELSLAFKPLRTGRTAFHTACFFGDLQFVRLVFEKMETYEPLKERDSLTNAFLNMTCEESGWTPLHYAVLSGSPGVMELLLEKGCDVSTLTDITHTWKKSDGRGLNSRELVEFVQSGNHEEAIETHGIALQEVSNAFLSHHQERRLFLRKLDRVFRRLFDVEKNGYTPPSTSMDDKTDDSETSSNYAPSTISEESSTRNKKKKKKKKKAKTGKESDAGNSTESALASATQAETAKEAKPTVHTRVEEEKQEDPLITALLGMGFTSDQINAAVKACGGTHRATADDLVSWILGQGDSNEDGDGDDATTSVIPESEQHETDTTNLSKKDESEAVKEAARKEQEETARRLAAKREEARRRNREWNNREQVRQQQQAKAKVAQKAVQQVYAPPRVAPSSGIEIPLQGVPTDVGKGMQRGTLKSAHLVTGMNVQTRLPNGRVPLPPHASMPAPQWHPSTVPSHTQSAGPPVQIGGGNTLPPPNETTSFQTSAPPHSGFVASNSYAQNNDDDKTVSSFGSNRGLSVSSREFVPQNFTSVAPVSSASIPPPGFLPATAQPMAVPPRQLVTTVPENSSALAFSEDGRQGEIRATAKAFVPSNFSQSNVSGSNLPLRNEYIPSEMHGAFQAGPASSSVFPPGLRSHNLQSGPVGPTTLLGSALPNSFDPVPSMTPVSEDSTAAGSSLVGVQNLEESALPVPLPFGMGESNTSSVGGSSLLSSISTAGAAGGSSIWGDSGSQNAHIPSIGSSLQPSFFGEGNDGIGNEKKPSWELARNSGQGIW